MSINGLSKKADTPNPFSRSPFLFEDLQVDKENDINIIIRMVLLWKSYKSTNFIFFVFEWLVHVQCWSMAGAPGLSEQVNELG